MRSPQEPSDCVSAVELLEATKPLYVKTDVLKQLRVEPGQPRLFERTNNEGDYTRPVRLVVPTHPQIPSTNSAFRPVYEPPPPLPPKSEQVKQQVRRLRVSPRTSPPPVPPRKLSDGVNEYVVPPVPKPRLSKMMSHEEKPEAKPRMVEDVREDEAVRRMLNEYRAANGRTVVAPSSSSQLSVSALKRRANMRTKSPMKCDDALPLVEMFPVMDDSERDYLREAVEQNCFGEFACDLEDSDASSPSELRFICKPSSALASPITDSGLPCSDCEDRRQHACSTKSEDDGFFDASLQKRDDESGSEQLTSVSNIRQETTVAETPELEARGTVSELERNARVIRWIHGCPNNQIVSEVI